MVKGIKRESAVNHWRSFKRDLFAINGSNDINARVILVKLDLDPDDRSKVQQLSGLNVTVTFEENN